MSTWVQCFNCMEKWDMDYDRPTCTCAPENEDWVPIGSEDDDDLH